MQWYQILDVYGLYLQSEWSTCQTPQYCLTLGPNTFPPFEKEGIVLNTTNTLYGYGSLLKEILS